DLDRLVHGLGGLAGGSAVVPGLSAVPVVGRGRRRAEPLRLATVLCHPRPDRVVDERQVDRGRQELEDDLAGVPHGLRVGADHHSLFDPARARRDQRPAAFHLDHAHPADVDRGEGGRPAHRRLVASDPPTGVEDRRPFGHRHVAAVDLERDEGRAGRLRSHRIPNSIADFTTEEAVWPKPQMDAAFIARSRSSMSRRSTAPFARAIASSTRTVPMRQGTHWPHDSSRKNWAMRRTTSLMSVEALKAMITPDPSVTPAARLSSNVSGIPQWSDPTSDPAAPPRSRAGI